MEMGEKIQFYRKANKLTQKQLSELSGVSEISIRKYEAGDRFPKPEQLKKIASVLEIGGNELLEIELQAVSVETVGDAMTLIYLLKEKLGMEFSYKVTVDGAIDPSSIQIHFKNEKINNCLERVITEESMAEQLAQTSIGVDDEATHTGILTDKLLLDITKEEVTGSKEILNQNNSYINI